MAKTLKLDPIVPYDPDVYTNGTIPAWEPASLDLKRGRIVKLDTSTGYIGAITLGTANTYYAILAEDTANAASAGSIVSVWPLKPGMLLVASFTDVLAQTTLGSAVGITLDATTGFLQLDDDDTNDDFQIMSYESGPGGADIGDTNARVIGVIDVDFLQFFD